MIRQMLRSAPPGQVARYLIVGAWNTLFGYGLYALLTYVLTPLLPCAYMFAAALGTVVCITVSFLGHKLWVFRSQGNFWKEYLRAYVVYGTANIVNLMLLPLLVAILNLFVRPQGYSPYIAGAVLTAVTVVVSFFGHQQYTFAQPRTPGANP